MSDVAGGLVPHGFMKGPMQGANIVGECTEAIHRFLMDGWTLDRPPPRIEEDLSFVPKDREEVIYVYMYRAERNEALVNDKRYRQAKFEPTEGSVIGDRLFFERAPIYLNLYYMISVHSKFRSDAERLMGYVLLRMGEASNLVYRPRRYILPDSTEVDSLGRPWSAEADGEGLVMEKVSATMVEDLTVGDAINFFTIHEAPYRPYLTFRAMCAMEGALIEGAATQIRSASVDSMAKPSRPSQRPSGRMGVRSSESTPKRPTPFGPQGHDLRRIEDPHDNEE